MVRCLFIFTALVVPTAILATELLDAPGRGYREFQSTSLYREDLLDALPVKGLSEGNAKFEAGLVKWFTAGVRYYSASSPLSPSVIDFQVIPLRSQVLLDGGLFDSPIQLFGVHGQYGLLPGDGLRSSRELPKERGRNTF